MKSKTSFFDQTTLRLDLTRFFPVWGLYTAILVSIILLAIGGSSDSLDAARMMADFISVTVTVNFFYALFSAQALFGYLYDSRLCGGLHALPMTRGCHFRTHVLSGLLFSLIPNLIAALVSLPLVKEGWAASGWWLLAVSGQYLFFFGFAVLCCFCAGNRVGGAACYALGNLLSPLLYWVADSLFRPLMYGVNLSFEPFSIFCPLIRLTQERAIQVTSRNALPFTANVKDISLSDYLKPGDVLDEIIPQGNYFLYLAVCAAVGLLLLAAAYGLYRRRALERAGELLAVQPLKPVFLTLFTLAAGCFLQLLCDIFLGADHSYLPLFIGIAVGYFACRMLMERQVKVFRPKALPPLAAIAAVLLLGLTLTALDVFHVTRRLPEAEDIASVEFTPISEFGTGMTLTNPEAIADFREIHSLQVKRWEDWRKEQGIGGLLNTTTYLPTGDNHTVRTDILYTLKDGSTLVRTYSVPVMSAPGELHEAASVDGEPEKVPEAKYRETREGTIFRKYLSNVENVLGITEAEIPALAPKLEGHIFISGNDYGSKAYLFSPQRLLEAIARDCKAGRMLPTYYLENDSWLGSLQIQNDHRWLDIPIFESYENTVRYLREVGFLLEE